MINGSPWPSSNLFHPNMLKVICPRALRTCTNGTDDHSSVLIPPRLTSGLLFCDCFSDNFQTDVQTCFISNWISMCCEAPFSFSSVTMWSLCALQTSFNQHGSPVVLTRTCSNTPNSEFINMNRVYNGCQTHITHHLQGNPCFPWSSLVFNGFPDGGIAVPLGPLWFLMVPPILKTFLVQRS